MLITYKEYVFFSILSFFLIDIFGLSGYLQIFAPIFFVAMNYYIIVKNDNLKNIKYKLIVAFFLSLIYIFLIYYKFSIEDPEYIENLAGTIPITIYFSIISIIYYFNYNNKKIKTLIGVFCILIPVIIFLIDAGIYGHLLIFSIELWEDFLNLIGFYY